jgi:hypothetical protein
MPGHGEKFASRKDEAITALLSHRTVEDAARAIGVAEKTLRRWLKRSDFEAELAAARQEKYQQARAWLEHGTGAAASIILKITLDPTVSASVRLRAAQFVVTQASKTFEQDVIIARITDLEQVAEKSKLGPHNQHGYVGGRR